MVVYHNKTKQQIIEGKFLFNQRSSSVSEIGKNLVKKLLNVDKIKRIKIDEVLTDEWFNDSELMKKAQQLINHAGI